MNTCPYNRHDSGVACWTFDAFGRSFHLHHRTSWPGQLAIYSGGGTGSLIQTYDMEREGPWPHWLLAVFPGKFLTPEDAAAYARAQFDAPPGAS